MYLLFDGGPLGNLQGHEDKLSIVVYAYDRLHLIDSGACSYDAPSEWRRYFSSTQAHNTLTVDDLGQNRIESIAQQSIKIEKTPYNWVSDNGFDFVSALYDEGYGPECLSVTHCRSILFVKPYFWVVIDSLTPRDSDLHCYKTFFHTNSSQVVMNSVGIETQHAIGSNLGIYGFEDPMMEVEVVSGQTDPVIQGWMTNDGSNNYCPSTTAVFKKSEEGFAMNVYLICPILEKSISPIKSTTLLSYGASKEEFCGKIGLSNGQQVIIAYKYNLKEPEVMGLLTDIEGRVERIHLINKQDAILGDKVIKKNVKLDI